LHFVSVTYENEYAFSHFLSTGIYTFVHIFSERLSGLMGDQITQDQIAEAVGVSQPTVGRWLKGTMPGGVEMVKLADFLRVHPRVLLGLEPVSATLHDDHRPPPPAEVFEAIEKIERMQEDLRAVKKVLQKQKGTP
jgi:transcriptional regulator with XRE-family HTH domain